MTQISELFRNGLKLFLSALISCICIFAVLRQVPFQELRVSLRIIDWTSILLGLASLSIGYSIRIFRWRYTLTKMNAKVTFGRCVTPFLGSIAMNNLLPFRVGDGVRAFVYPKRMKIRTSIGMSSLLIEKILDLCVLAVFLAVGIFTHGTFQIPLYVFIALSFLTFLSLALILMLFLIQKKAVRIFLLPKQNLDRKAAGRLSGLVINVAEDSRLLFNAKTIFVMTSLSFVVWICESGLYYFVLQGYGLSPTPVDAVFVSSVISISTMVPSLPGYIGPFQAAAFLSISILGGEKVIGVSFALIAHLSLWLPTTLIGLIAIGSDYDLFRRAGQKVAAIKVELKK